MREETEEEEVDNTLLQTFVIIGELDLSDRKIILKLETDIGCRKRFTVYIDF